MPRSSRKREKTLTYRSRFEKMAGGVRSWWLVIRAPRRLALSIRHRPTRPWNATPSASSSATTSWVRAISPYADRLDAGVLGLYVTTARTPAEIVRVTAEAAVGLVSISPLIEHLTSQAVDIAFPGRHMKATVDGELVRLTRPITVESVPGALKVLAPA